MKLARENCLGGSFTLAGPYRIAKPLRGICTYLNIYINSILYNNDVFVHYRTYKCMCTNIVYSMEREAQE